MLTDRLAAFLEDRPPGWRLPRRSDLARRYGVTADDIDAAISQLAGRHVVRQLADGQVYLASPAEYLLALDQLPYLGCRIDPMGNKLTCTSRSILHRHLPEEITRALQLKPENDACAVQSTWAMDGTVSALSITYLPASLAATLVPAGDSQDGPGTAEDLEPLSLVPLPRNAAAPAAVPGALYLEVQPPPRSAARILRLRPAEPAITITVRLDDPSTGTPLALTVAVLHAARFRIALQTPETPLGATAHTAEAAAAGLRPLDEPPADQDAPRTLNVNGVRLDLDGYRVFANGTEIALSRKEYDLLRVLVENAGRALTRRDLLDIVWRPGYIDHNKTLEVHVRRLRQKLNAGLGAPSRSGPGAPSRIRTVRGVGYVFDVVPTRVSRRSATV